MEKQGKRSQAPHMAVITFKIDCRQMLSDGSVDPIPVHESEYKKYGMTNLAKIKVEGFDRADCLRKAKNLLLSLNDGKDND